MDNSIEYAKMIEVPVSTCEYINKRKPFFFKKKKVIKSVNKLIEKQGENKCENCGACPTLEENFAKNECESADNKHIEALPAVYDEKVAKREKRKSAIISVQVAVIFALISAIILTNVFWENSGMNTLFKSVFSAESNIVDERDHNDFTLTLPINSESGVTVAEGAISIAGSYSLYPVCEGVVSKVEQAEDGSFTITVKHSESFVSVSEGLDLVYFTQGEEVNRNMPVGYVKNNAKVYLYNDGSLITDYATVENSIVFNK
ncbi:MAG: hypothetical protein IJA15_05255 [Clostridia bacterium]|nr:hypothetical protein [Clostridia bacterium]